MKSITDPASALHEYIELVGKVISETSSRLDCLESAVANLNARLDLLQSALDDVKCHRSSTTTPLKPTLCPHCRYRLHQTRTPPICPECGNPTSNNLEHGDPA